MGLKKNDHGFETCFAPARGSTTHISNNGVWRHFEKVLRDEAKALVGGSHAKALVGGSHAKKRRKKRRTNYT